MTGNWVLAGYVLAICACGRLGFDTLAPDASTFDTRAVGPFGAPEPIPALSSPASEQEPTISGDKLVLVFRRGDALMGDLHVSTRSTATEPWGAPVPIAEINTTDDEITPGLSADALTLWFSSNRAGGVGGNDIWVTTRVDRASPWSSPVNVTELNTSGSDRNPAVTEDGLTMILTRTVAGQSDLYAASRSSPSGAWSVPAQLTELSSTVNDGGGGLIGLEIVFYSNRPGATGQNDLWRATRSSAAEPFTSIEPIAELNSTATDWDPWMSIDGSTIVFGSNRSGDHEIYEATR